MAKPIVKLSKRAKKRVKKQEISRLGQALRSLGGMGGSAVGGYFGMPTAGLATGTALGAALSRWLGSGDYKLSSNSLISTPNVPAMHSTSQSVRIRHKEYVMPIKGTADFSVSTLNINPINSSLFPWLSGLARCYQQYAIRGMVFHYVPTSGVAISGTNPALGSVMLQTSYRAGEPAPANKMEMMNEYWATEGAPSTNFIHPIECDTKEMPFQIHYVGIPPTLDQTRLMYDWGNTYVATTGMPASGNVVGDLWVTYDIEFKKPEVSTNTDDTNFAYGSSSTATQANIFGGVGWFPNSFTTSNGFRKLTISPGRYARYFINVLVTPSGGATFSAADMNVTPTLTNATSETYDRTVGGSSLQLNTASSSLLIKVSNPAETVYVDYFAPTSLTPNTGLNVTIFVLGII